MTTETVWISRGIAALDRFVPASLQRDPVDLLRARLLLAYSATVLAFCPLFVGVSLVDERPDLAAITGAAMLIGSLTGPMLRRTGSVAGASIFAIATYGATHATLFFNAGFFDLSSLYWCMSTPMFATFLRGTRAGLRWLAAVSVIALGVAASSTTKHLVDATPYDPRGDIIGAWVLGVVLLLFAALYEFIRARSTEAMQLALEATATARAHAEESGEARSRLVASISHELRTPLGGVVGLVHLLEQTPLSREQRELTNLIGESADAVVALLNDLLEFTRLDVGGVPVERLPLDPRRVVRGVVGLFAGRVTNVDIHVDISDEVPELLIGDARRLRQVLWNLVGNAVKFAPLGRDDGGRGRVAVTVEVARSEPGAPADVVWVRFSVADTGPGISDEIRQRLFQPFTQGHSDVHRRLGGTGLGLAISQNLVVALGGRGIELDTRVGEGSRFHTALPFARAATAAAARPSGRVLIVEDDPVSALVACRMIEAAGLACDVVGDGHAAVAAALNGGYDLVLMDGNLPGRDGYDATRAIRAAERTGTARVPIVALTATSTPDERARALDAGMDGHLHKPLDPARLTTLLDLHFRRGRSDAPRPDVAAVAD